MGSLLGVRNVCCIHFFLLLFLSCSVTANESTDRAISWLLDQQKANGSIHRPNDIATEFQTSAEVAKVLRVFGKSAHPQVDLIHSYINSSVFDDSTENLARRISLNYRNGASVTADVDVLLSHKNDDGGFGTREGYDSTVIDTAYALWGLGLANVSSSSITNEAIAFIVSEQLVDGSWTNDSRPHESIALTSLVLETLRLYSVRFNLQQTINRASNYLHAQKNAAGIWVGNEHTTDALVALIPITTEPSIYTDALTHLKSSQLPNGSWSNDTYITARALYSIYLSENLPPPAVSSNENITGQLVDQSTGQLLAGVSIHLSGVATAAVVTDSLGQFSLGISERGLYTLAFEIAGFKTKVVQVNVTKLQAVNLGQVRLEPDVQVDPTIAIVYGVILDAITQLPLEGVDVVITGEQTTSVSTDSNGMYTASVGGGPLNVIVRKSGYQEIGASATITLGQRVLFSPVLYPDGEPAPTTVGLQGRVVDATSGSAIANAKVTLEYSDSVVVLDLDNSGEIDVSDLATGSVKITVSALGYRASSANAFFTSGTVANVGEVRLVKLAASTTLHGMVKNAVDQQVIPFALIKVIDSPLNASAKTDGSYEIADISSLEFTVEVSAPGFKTKATRISSPEFQSIHLDVSLDPVDNENGFGIHNLTSEFSQYPAYQKATLFADFYNNASNPVDLQMVIELKGSNGYYLRAPVSHLAFAGDEIADSLLHIPANSSSVRVSFEWLTDIIPPDQYEVKLLAYDLDSLQFLAEKVTYLEIQTTKVVSAVVGSVTPKFSYLNAEPTISFNVDITNQSNIAYELPISYKWLSPDGTVINQGIEVVSLTPATYRKSVLLKSFTSKFTKSGDYELAISIDNNLGIDIGSIVSPKVSVAPSVRIDPIIEIAPTVVTPESDKTIKVTFKLKGIEENE